ncbi:MAG: hypothetical protein DMF59_09630 [Acidobacteria bacterium]|nr:MAG: hypothetical protein DMF59_09630 [Acidobacteriota bacterium]
MAAGTRLVNKGRRQKAEGRRQKAEGRRQKAEAGTLVFLLPSAFCLGPSVALSGAARTNG